MWCIRRGFFFSADMEALTFEDHRGDLHRLVYIEYWRGKPHAAITDLVRMPGAASNWDIEEDQKLEEKGYYMYYESGGFGLEHRGVDIQADEYWIGEGIIIDSVAPHSKRLAEPLDVKLFEDGREVFDMQYCKVCDAFYDEDLCWMHHREKKNGEIGYKKGFRKRDQAPATPAATAIERGGQS